MKSYRPILFGGLALLSSLAVQPLAAQEPAQDQGAGAEVKAVAQRFLAALSAADTSILAPLMAPQAMIYSVREGGGGPSFGAVSREVFLKSLGGEEQTLLERMWDPTVLVQDRVAMVWTPYDFHLNGEFSHCGIDVFTLLRGAEGWQVASITYNVVREGCPPSPLGPPGGRRR
ncbi:MAG: hypothetical protein PVJ76_16310 [Gemmatimonadota bacterium]|jgi:hypothetical protein